MTVDRFTKEKTRYLSSWQAATIPYWSGKAYHARPILCTRKPLQLRVNQHGWTYFIVPATTNNDG